MQYMAIHGNHRQANGKHSNHQNISTFMTSPCCKEQQERNRAADDERKKKAEAKKQKAWVGLVLIFLPWNVKIIASLHALCILYGSTHIRSNLFHARWFRFGDGFRETKKLYMYAALTGFQSFSGFLGDCMVLFRMRKSTEREWRRHVPDKCRTFRII